MQYVFASISWIDSNKLHELDVFQAHFASHFRCFCTIIRKQRFERSNAMGLPLTASGPADVIKQVSDLSRSLSRDVAQQYLRSARETLAQLIRVPNLLDGISLQREPHRYTRNFLFGDSCMSVWAIVWAPGSSTSIHDHHCSCSFAVLNGSLREIWFDADGDGQAVKTAEALRAPGYIACMFPSGPNIHQMTNDGQDEAISIHIYGFDHRRHASSVEREYRLASL